MKDAGDDRDGLRVALERDGHQVVCVPTADHAMEALRAGERPHVILLDLATTDDDGVSFRDAQRRLPSIAGVPIVSLSTGENGAVFPNDDVVLSMRDPHFDEELRETVRETIRAARLAHVERLASLGRLSAGIVHEVRNPLTAVVCALETVRSQVDALMSTVSDPKARRTLDQIGETLSLVRDGSDHIERLVGDVKLFAHPDESSRGPVDATQVMRSSLRLVEKQMQMRATVEVDVEATPWVIGNASALAQVFLNLLVNASEARDPAKPAHHVTVASRVSDDRAWAIFEISDTGVGMSRAVQARVFEAFFTTKPAGRGTGLGLWLSERIIASHGGRLEVSSDLGIGTTFRVVLPAATATRRTMPRPRAVLAVVREDAMARLCTRMLRSVAQVRVSPDLGAVAETLRAGSFDALIIDAEDVARANLDAALSAAKASDIDRVVMLGAAGKSSSSFRVVDKPFDRPALLDALGWTERA